MNVQPVPDLPEFATWLNATPSTLIELRGRPVALVFVNAASVWCAQRLAELGQWQSRNPGRAHVLVLQVPRFDAERDPGVALKLLRRQGLSAPALLDADWDGWRRFGVSAWPTVVLLDGQGRERERLVGLGSAGELERALNALCADAGAQTAVQPTELHPEPRQSLRFPTGLAVSSDRLYIADTGHHRILECSHGGRVLRQFGLGTADFIDGSLAEAAFHRPQALALERESLYVADTGNHAVRRINLLTGRVDTLCGNGRPGAPSEVPLRDAHSVSLNHPHGLAVVDNQLFIAMAGDNRIWSYHLGQRSLQWCVGSGAIDERDGSGHMAAFAQPTALAVVQQVLYVADALGSSVRSLQLRGELVQTLVGQGMWRFGSDDGPRATASLQFPQAIALSPAAPLLWIADTGNGRLRTLRLGGGELSTVALPRQLHGPPGLAAGAGAVWIAETDSHAVLRYDPDSGVLSDVPISE
ncbi:MAG: Protein DipZ [Stenotrophomonas maltophilia]|uniref:Protein DipZ n=1 Tax=Stenotrophomonas maltophilia TaxID=40324 RepID=A0A7V8JMQ8_STEMA|nr:MAG: Protein DipZ [Stenotrophomonas maltophilia]